MAHGLCKCLGRQPGLWIMDYGTWLKRLGRGPGLWHMDYVSAWEENGWIMDYGTWIMSSSSQDKGGLWIMDYEPVNKTRREVDYGLWKP